MRPVCSSNLEESLVYYVIVTMASDQFLVFVWCGEDFSTTTTTNSCKVLIYCIKKGKAPIQLVKLIKWKLQVNKMLTWKHSRLSVFSLIKKWLWNRKSSIIRAKHHSTVDSWNSVHSSDIKHRYGHFSFDLCTAHNVQGDNCCQPYHKPQPLGFYLG